MAIETGDEKPAFGGPADRAPNALNECVPEDDKGVFGGGVQTFGGPEVRTMCTIPQRKSKKVQVSLAVEPWERVSVDITGPHPRESRGNQYITLVDHFSK